MTQSNLSILYPEKPRANCKDIWNGYILKNATFDKYDIPFCPTTAVELPKALISITDAKKMYEEEMEKGNTDFKYDAFIHPYSDDQIFDGIKEGFWNKPDSMIKLAKHFSGMITIDYSTYLDFPDPLKRWNVFRSRTLGIHSGNNGIPTINNVRWGEEETWGYSFSGLPKNDIYAIGTVASGIHQHGYKEIFIKGLIYFVNRFQPKVLIIYGSDNLPIFDELRNKGIKVITFKSDTASYFERRENNE